MFLTKFSIIRCIIIIIIIITTTLSYHILPQNLSIKIEKLAHINFTFGIPWIQNLIHLWRSAYLY